MIEFRGFGSVLRGFGVLGVLRGSRGGLLDPYKALFAPLEVLYSTRFGSKHYIKVQLAKVYWVSTTDPFLAN